MVFGGRRHAQAGGAAQAENLVIAGLKEHDGAARPLARLIHHAAERDGARKGHQRPGAMDVLPDPGQRGFMCYGLSVGKASCIILAASPRMAARDPDRYNAHYLAINRQGKRNKILSRCAWLPRFLG
jgi:hypothetical protein